MLFVTGLGTQLGDLQSDLVSLQKQVSRCVRAFPLGNSNADASMAVTCDMLVGGHDTNSGIRTFEKLSLIDQADNAVMASIAHDLLTGWYNTGTGGAPSTSEANVRRIAAQKLGEEPVLEGLPAPQAVFALSSAARRESNDTAKLAMIKSLGYLLRTRNEDLVPHNVRTEAITTLKIFADPNVQRNPYILNAANDALKDLNQISLDIGPATVTPVQKPRSPYFIPIVATATTAVLATGTLLAIFWRPGGHGLSGAGPLRRKVEAAYRRRRAQ
jgi:hypothetical protein